MKNIQEENIKLSEPSYLVMVALSVLYNIQLNLEKWGRCGALAYGGSFPDIDST